MPSKEVLEELHKIAQESTENIIDYDEFSKDLLESVKATQVEKNEYDNFFNIILSHAKSKQSFGRYSNGRFVISGKIVKSAEEKIKYERQFISGTKEYENRMNGKRSTTEIIGNSILIDKMLEDYSKLSVEEKINMFNLIGDMTDEQFKKFISDFNQCVDKNVKNGLISPEDGEKMKESNMYERIISTGTKEEKGILILVDEAKHGNRNSLVALKIYLGRCPKLSPIIEELISSEKINDLLQSIDVEELHGNSQDIKPETHYDEGKIKRIEDNSRRYHEKAVYINQIALSKENGDKEGERKYRLEARQKGFDILEDIEEVGIEGLKALYSNLSYDSENKTKISEIREEDIPDESSYIGLENIEIEESGFIFEGLEDIGSSFFEEPMSESPVIDEEFEGVAEFVDMIVDSMEISKGVLPEERVEENTTSVENIVVISPGIFNIENIVASTQNTRIGMIESVKKSVIASKEGTNKETVEVGKE